MESPAAQVWVFGNLFRSTAALDMDCVAGDQMAGTLRLMIQSLFLDTCSTLLRLSGRNS